jgi:hypothetical protein
MNESEATKVMVSRMEIMHLAVRKPTDFELYECMLVLEISTTGIHIRQKYPS